MKCLLAIYMLCANAPVIVLDYSDFGPQAMAYELIGFQWWQWEKPCCSEPDSIYNIKVVVYKDIALNEVKALFPVNPEQQQDYRYLEYSKAVSYLNQHIQDDEMPSLLKETKRKIVESLVQGTPCTPELPSSGVQGVPCTNSSGVQGVPCTNEEEK